MFYPFPSCSSGDGSSDPLAAMTFEVVLPPRVLVLYSTLWSPTLAADSARSENSCT